MAPPMTQIMHKQVSQLFKAACLAELEALKPGNVHIFADGHGMTVNHFIQSAEAVAKVIALPDLTLGQRILHSVQATQKAVACNTNLGIILLCAPLVHAALMVNDDQLLNQDDLLSRLKYVLQHTTIDDANLTFEAINLAKPAGLGTVNEHDVQRPADCTLLQAMQTAAWRDTIAAQYNNNFDAIFNLALPILQTSAEDKNPAWLTTQVYLTFLAIFPDSHLVRKYGEAIASDIQHQAKEHLTIFNISGNPKLYQAKLLAWDNEMKQKQLNPGTSADLTVASLFVHAFTQLLKQNDG